MKYKRLIYTVLFLLLLFVVGYFIFTGIQIREVNQI